MIKYGYFEFELPCVEVDVDDDIREGNELYRCNVKVDVEKDYYGADYEGKGGVIVDDVGEVEIVEILDSDGDVTHNQTAWDFAESIKDGVRIIEED